MPFGPAFSKLRVMAKKSTTIRAELEKAFPGFEFATVKDSFIHKAYQAQNIDNEKIHFIVKPYFFGGKITHADLWPSPIYIQTLKPGVQMNVSPQGTVTDLLQSLGFNLDLQLNDKTLDHNYFIKIKPDEERSFCEEYLRQPQVKQLLRGYISSGVPSWRFQHQHFAPYLPTSLETSAEGVDLKEAQRIVRFVVSAVKTFDALPLPLHPLQYPKSPPSWFKKKYPELKPIKIEDKTFEAPSGAPIAVRFSDLDE